jgi:hypothetical protein
MKTYFWSLIITGLAAALAWAAAIRALIICLGRL